MRRAVVACVLALAALGAARTARADFDAALRAFTRGDDAAAAQELAPLAAAGSPAALHLLGVMRESGRGGPRDAQAAARLYRKAADAGNVPAMTDLARLYLRGDGVARNDELAGRYLQRAAAKGSARALFLLGAMRLENRGGPATDAPGYLRRAVQAGSAQAALTLGELHLAGRVAAHDPAAAYRLALAGQAQAGDDPALAAHLAALAEAAKKQLDPTVALSLAGKAASAKDRKAPPPEEAAKRLATGTGFVVSRLGHVLTNAHVAADCGRVVAVVDGKRTAARVTRIDRKNDLALLELAVAPPRALAFREGGELPEGAAVFAAGYPGQAAVSGTMRVTAGRTRTLADGVGPRGEQAITAQVLPGNSGGPLLDAAGHVAGVVTARRDTDGARERLGETPAEMGFVVPLAVVKAFLARGQTPISASPSDRVLDAEGVAAAIAGAVLPLWCLPKGR